ncbi:MAG: lyase family protein, partial [Opitutales bacterium]
QANQDSAVEVSGALKTIAVSMSKIANDIRLMGTGPQNPSAARAVGYRETLLHLDGKYSRTEWQEAVFVATMRLARKQRKWFRSRLPTDRTILLSADQTTVNSAAPWEV